ncbi:hypothetical protein [Prescottella agglutinans]|uniref:Uncharacterized protein n=1 Tax=Prescottella agglutinans TaxID=1644129 RepID=A0ABT6MAN4_9NOCA|nr:hypothetical protein [Prescottella agglutinans]MDH6281368.1 hypothetical protein [Prescottella agglutinans]
MTLRHFRSTFRAAAHQNVFVHIDSRDLPAEYVYDSIREIAASPGLRLVGLCCALPPRASAADVRSAVHESVLLMERFHVDCDIVLTQLVLEESEEDLGVRSIPLQHRHDLLEMVDDALESVCERTRFPRPTLTLMADVHSRVGSGAGVR